MSELAWLDDVRQRVADREPVDWDACTRDAQVARALSDDDLRELAFLRVLDEIGVVHSQLQTGDLLDGDGGTAAAADAPRTPAAPAASIATAAHAVPAAPSPGDDTLTSWGRYRLDEKVGRGGFGIQYAGADGAGPECPHAGGSGSGNAPADAQVLARR